MSTQVSGYKFCQKVAYQVSPFLQTGNWFSLHDKTHIKTQLILKWRLLQFSIPLSPQPSDAPALARSLCYSPRLHRSNRNQKIAAQTNHSVVVFTFS
jgi:hypothetical protein